MKVLAICHYYPTNTNQIKGKFHHNSLASLARLGHSVTVFSYLPKFGRRKSTLFDRTANQDIFIPYILDGVQVYPISYIPGFSFHFPFLEILLKVRSGRKAIKKLLDSVEKPDVIYAMTLSPDGQIAEKIASGLSLPFAVLMIGSDVHRYPDENPKLLNLIRTTLNNADIVFSVCRKLGDDAKLKFLGSIHEIETLYLTCDTAKYKPALRKQHQGTHLLYIGHITPEKGVFELIDAFDILSKKHNNLSLTIRGTGRSKPQLIKLLNERKLTDIIKFPDQLDEEELITLFQSADIFVFPSYAEGLPNAVVEAVASSLPVVTSDVGGVTEIA
ncbi:glycosyltransferase, partial [Calditrichota bacterium]